MSAAVECKYRAKILSKWTGKQMESDSAEFLQQQIYIESDLKEQMESRVTEGSCELHK